MNKKWVCLVLALIVLGPAAAGRAAELAHRWSFNGTLADSVGGQDAVLVDLGANNAVLSDSAVTLTGGGRETSDYIDLPDHVLSSLGDSATIEVWATQVTIQNWSRIWDFGVSTTHNVFMSWTSATTLNADRVEWVSPTGNATADNTVAPYTLGTEFHIVCTFQPGAVRWYAAPSDAPDLGPAQGSLQTQNLLSNLDDTNAWIGRSQWPDNTANAIFNEFRLWKGALSEAEMEKLHDMGPDTINASIASNPVPANAATDVPRDALLSWTAGETAATHDVYLGASLADVTAAGTSDPMGVLVSQGQGDTSFDAGRLAFGQTYYWRIDEVNAAPDYTVFEGGVWSFTVEPYAYPIANVIATASSAQPGMGAENTVNGSGLNADDEHSTALTDMWMATGVAPNWIQFELDNVYKLHEMRVWNSNQLIEAFMGFGAKEVAIEYSTDGQTWTALENVPEFARASGAATYTANTTVDFGGVMARFVKLTINSNWGGVAPQTGLSEVRFFAVPVRARAPMPADAATDVSIAAELNWRPGREAASHQVYFGADAKALALTDTVTNHRFVPEAMNLGTTYYWRVDEVGDSGTYEGEVWSFTTEPFAVVDDFESYNDDDHRIYESWIDGLTEPARGGSQVGYDASPFAEKTIIHGGSQSMPLIYNNAGASIAEAQFDVGQDWTASGIKSLSLWFRGQAGNTGKLYVKINNTKVSYDGPATDIAATQWLPWNIDLSAVAGNLGNVASLTIGVEGSGASGALFIDDIRLYPRTPEFVVPVPPTNAGLVAQWQFENNLRDSVGANHGTASGDAKVASDPVRGQVLSLDGNGDYVDIPYNAALNPAAFTVSLWAWPDSAGTDYRSPITSRDGSPQRGYILYIAPTNVWEFWNGTGSGWNATAGATAQFNEWSHVAATFADGQKMLYINGRLAGQSSGAVMSLNTQRPVRLGAGATEGAAAYFFRGLIDDVRLYDRPMSAEEVAGLAGHTNPLPKPF